MSQQHINYGTSANDPTADTVRAAFQKAEANFGELYGVTAPVQSVAGRTGAVTLTTSDVSGLTAMATLATAAQGSVVYMGASGPAVLAPGTSGFVLQTNGASANPSWIALGGGGTITGVTAGTGLSGGGSSGTVTVTLGQASNSTLGGVTFSATNPAAPGSAAPGSATSAARSDHVHPTDTTRAPLASPVFTGSMTLPTWATAGRPASPTAGMEGWNTDLVRRETWNGAAWVQYVRTGDLPSATTSQLYGGTGAAGAAAVVTIGSGLSLSGGTLAATGGGGSSTTPVTTVATSGATQTVSFPASGNAAYDVTLSANCTFTVTGGTAAQMQTVSVQLRAGTGGFTTTWPAAVVWKGGSAPSAALTSGQVLLVQLRTLDAGTTIIGDF